MNENTQSLQKWLENYRRGLPAPESIWPDRIARAFLYIHHYLFEQWLTVVTVREHCNVSNNNFSGRFKCYIGCGIKKYIQLQRLRAARQVLDNREFDMISLFDISLHVGFAGYTSFHNAFKQTYGVSPAKYRNGK